MHRKTDPLNDMITQLRGINRYTGQDEVITLLFDRNVFSEVQAREWWAINRDRFIGLS